MYVFYYFQYSMFKKYGDSKDKEFETYGTMLECYFLFQMSYCCKVLVQIGLWEIKTWLSMTWHTNYLKVLNSVDCCKYIKDSNITKLIYTDLMLIGWWNFFSKIINFSWISRLRLSPLRTSIRYSSSTIDDF